jgi:hypothetical protein
MIKFLLTRVLSSHIIVITVFLFLVIIGCSITSNSRMKFVWMLVEYEENPINIDESHSRFSWITSSQGRNRRQTAYGILVSSSLYNLDSNNPDLWDSGKIESGETIQHEYLPGNLQSESRYFWKIIIWDGDGISCESPSAKFETAFLPGPEWSACWIGNGPENDPLPPKGFYLDRNEQSESEDTVHHDGFSLLLRYEAETKKNVKNAKAYITGVLEIQSDKEYFKRLASDIQFKINNTFMDTISANYNDGSQMANSFPLYLGIVPEYLKSRVLENLLKDIEVTHRTHLTTGVLGTKYMPEALADSGYADIACRIINQKTAPCWNGVRTSYPPMCEFWTLKQSNEFLKDTPLDLVDWPIDHTIREDVTIVRKPILEEVQVEELPSARERSTVRWDINSWAAIQGNAQQVREPVFWLWPYWLARYLNVIQPSYQR